MTETTEQPPGHVLIVDDDVIMRDVAGGSLIAAGFKVSTAENGARAMEALDDLGPMSSCWMSMMPEMDGFDTALPFARRRALRCADFDHDCAG